MENHGGMASTGEKWFVCQSSLAILPAVNWQQAGRTGEGNDKFGLAKYFCSYLQVTFYMPQNLTT
jgi:hypothetical protein